MGCFNVSFGRISSNLSAGLSVVSAAVSFFSGIGSNIVASSACCSVGAVAEIFNRIIMKSVPSLPETTLTQLKGIGFYISEKEFMNASQTEFYTERDIKGWLYTRYKSYLLTMVRNMSLLVGSGLLNQERSEVSKGEASWIEVAMEVETVLAAVFLVGHVCWEYRCDTHPGMTAIRAAAVPAANNEITASISSGSEEET